MEKYYEEINGFEEEIAEAASEAEEIAEEEAMSLVDFLAENPVDELTEEVTLSERLKNFKFKIGGMSKEEREKYINLCLVKDKKGKILKQNITKFNELVAINHCIYPDFKSVDFLKKCKAQTPEEALYKTLKLGEVEKLADSIMELNGFDFEEVRKQAKN